jgi:hypothetical protein
MSNIAFAWYEVFMADFSCPGQGEADTKKGGDWVDLELWNGCDGDRHDIYTWTDVAGTGIDVTAGQQGGHGNVISRDNADPICNTTFEHYYGSGGHDNLRLEFANLLPHTKYIVHTYHTWSDGDITAVQFDYAVDPCVISEPNVTNYTFDANLLADDVNMGVIEFTTDCGPNKVSIKFTGYAKFNAFILYSEVPYIMAKYPNPPTGGRTGEELDTVCPNGVQLSWQPARQTQDPNGHDVYFGTDYNDVNEATRASHPNMLYYSEGQDSNKYPQDGNLPQLEVGTTYYWRVDQVNDVDMYKGRVWDFTTEDGNASTPFPYDPYRYDWDELQQVDFFRGLNPSDTNLWWTTSCVANEQKLWFGTDLPGSILLLKDDFESGAFEPNWTSVGWDIWDANDDPCWAHFRPRDHNMARATSGGVKTLTSTDIDASDDCNAIRVSFYVRSTKGRWLGADELTLKYYDGSTYNKVDEFDVSRKKYDPNGRWVHFRDRITDSNYLISNFRIQLYADLSDSNVLVDDVTISNSWPVNPIWRKATLSGDANDYTPALSPWTHYYWRVDTVVGNELVQGEYWEFRTGLGGLLLEMLFDGGTPGSDLPPTVTDTSDNSLVFTTYANIYDPCADGSVKYADPRFDVTGTLTSADFDPCAGLYRKDPCGPNDVDLLRLDGWQYTHPVLGKAGETRP